MYITGVDERDSSWERHQPIFRVYFFEGGDEPSTSWRTDTFDIRGSDVLEVVAWAQRRAGEHRLYAVALVDEDRSVATDQRRGLTWLLGTDANGITGDEDETQRRAFEAMLARRERPAIPDG